MVWPLIGMVAAAAIGGGLSYLGQQSANKANSAQAAAANAASAAAQEDSQGFNAEQAEINRQFNKQEAEIARDFNSREAATARAWSEQMSGTSYQRAMHDMKAAGLNPLLGYQQGGAATPSASSASAGAASGSAASSSGFTGQQARMENELGPAAASAFRAAETIGGLQHTMATIDNVEADTIRKAAETRNLDAQTGLRTLEAINTKGVIPENIASQTRRNIADAALRNVQTGQQVMESEDYRNYGPSSTLRDPLVTGERVGRRIAPTVAPPIRRGAEAVGEAAANAPRPGAIPRDPRSWREIIDQTVLRHLR